MGAKGLDRLCQVDGLQWARRALSALTGEDIFQVAGGASLGVGNRIFPKTRRGKTFIATLVALPANSSSSSVFPEVT